MEKSHMPLVLSLRAGQDFYVNDEQVLVHVVRDPRRFDLKVVSSGRVFAVTDQEAVEIMEDVFVSAGDRPQNGLARVAIDAPREIEILRGDRYRGEEKPEPVDAGCAEAKFKKGSQLWPTRSFR
jgi:sRNA-binding carbon storage regulator CsrA